MEQAGNHENRGLWYGFVGVLAFSLTLPMTKLAVAAFDPVVVGLGRALVAAMLAALLLLVTHQPLPHKRQLVLLGVVGAGVTIGFSLLSAWALQRVPSAHGAVIIGLIPLTTAVVSVLRTDERPSRGFWVASILGSLTVVGFALRNGAGRLQLADLALLGAVVAAAVGYAEGGQLARELGGWQVISWALVLIAPVLVIPVGWVLYRHGMQGPMSAWLGFTYVAIVSQFLGFFAWYHGLALGGVARVSQLQLLQPFLTIIAAVVLLHESITPLTIGTAILVMAFVALGKRTMVAKRHQQVDVAEGELV
ncbi:MAG: DMT family transporter [Herpetosiphonaceae bacterium]|nr:DMT family transporter [Herpetosiphonaceae bacterium]